MDTATMIGDVSAPASVAGRAAPLQHPAALVGPVDLDAPPLREERGAHDLGGHLLVDAQVRPALAARLHRLDARSRLEVLDSDRLGVAPDQAEVVLPVEEAQHVVGLAARLGQERDDRPCLRVIKLRHGLVSGGAGASGGARLRGLVGKAQGGRTEQGLAEQRQPGDLVLTLELEMTCTRASRAGMTMFRSNEVCALARRRAALCSTPMDSGAEETRGAEKLWGQIKEGFKNPGGAICVPVRKVTTKVAPPWLVPGSFRLEGPEAADPPPEGPEAADPPGASSEG
eukprot:scaffold16213_cov58-Phaeocystis_antarctica.AAC.1